MNIIICDLCSNWDGYQKEKRVEKLKEYVEKEAKELEKVK